MPLNDIGLSEHIDGRDRIAILVGPNGSGKSNYLRKIATSYRTWRNVAVVSNTAFDRFKNLQNITRFTAGRGGKSVNKIVKETVLASLEDGGGGFFKASSVLEFSGYQPKFGFNVGVDKEALARFIPDGTDNSGLPDQALEFLRRIVPGEPIWIDTRSSSFEFSRSIELSAVLRNENHLRELGLITRIVIHIEKLSGQIVRLNHASSGELSLISSLLFIDTMVPAGSLILIDEPENSLHPNWQHEYIDLLKAAIGYRDMTVVIATHAPLIVTGAFADERWEAMVNEMVEGSPVLLNLEYSRGSKSVEEILWRVFGVITPANHFVSKQLVKAVEEYENERMSLEALLSMVGRMQGESFDPEQQKFFVAVRKLIDEIAQRRAPEEEE